MPLPSSGSISLSQIQTEFGGANPISISEYYKGGAYVSASDNAPNVPSSGQIDFNDFWGASKALAPPSIEIYVLSGGAYGGGPRGGGGGSGSLFYGSAMTVISGTYTVTVGAVENFSAIVGPLGGGVSATAQAGGRGGSASPAGSNPGNTGGSGGGGAGSPGNPFVPGGTYGTSPYLGVTGTIYDSASEGGYGSFFSPLRGSGGGGGTAGLTYNGATGGSGSGSGGGAGGNGYTWPYDGVTRGGGGGGAPNGPGGTGGGGAGSTVAGGNAPANSGSGGGGGSPGGIGGSGVILIRYSSTYSDAISVTGSPTYTNSGGFKTYFFTGSGTIQWK